MEVIAHRTGPSRSKTTYYLLLVGLFVGSILIFSSWLNLYRAVGQRQLQERVVERRADFVPPVTILSAKAKRGEFRFGEKVLDDDDWFKGLTVEVHNESLKTVIYVGVEVTFRRPEKDSKEPPASWQLEYGDDPFRYKTQEAVPPLRVKPVSPGETVEINLSYQNFDDIKLFLKSAKYSLSPKSIELRVTDIGFDDGIAWHAGRFLRRDANNSWGWSPVNS